MELITKKQLASIFISRFKAQYVESYVFQNGTTSDIIIERLRNVKNLTEEKIFKVVGNKSWTSNKCHECNREVEQAVWIGEELDYESSSARVCKECLIKAIGLFEDVKYK